MTIKRITIVPCVSSRIYLYTANVRSVMYMCREEAALADNNKAILQQLLLSI